MNRRDFIRYLLATPVALSVDVEKLLWVPKPIIVVPELGIYGRNLPNIGQIVASAWEAYVGKMVDTPFLDYWELN